MVGLAHTASEHDAWVAAAERIDARRVRRIRASPKDRRTSETARELYHAHILEQADRASKDGVEPDGATLEHILAVQKYKDMRRYNTHFAAHLARGARDAMTSVPIEFVVDEFRHDVAEIDEAIARFGADSFMAEAVAVKLFDAYFEDTGDGAVYDWPVDVRYAAFELIDADGQGRYAEFAREKLFGHSPDGRADGRVQGRVESEDDDGPANAGGGFAGMDRSVFLVSMTSVALLVAALVPPAW